MIPSCLRFINKKNKHIKSTMGVIEDMRIFHWLNSKTIVYALSVMLLNQGCAVFHPDKLKTENGYYERHFNSCGPVAIRQALNEYDAKLGIVYVREPYLLKEISKEIQKNGNGRRLALTIVHYDALEITWPAELKKCFTSRGYKVTVATLDSLGADDIAIALIHGSILKLQWHWITYPTYTVEQIKNFYKTIKRETSVIIVYKIEKK